LTGVNFREVFELSGTPAFFDIHLGDPGVVDEAILKRGSFGHSRMPGTRAVYGQESDSPSGGEGFAKR
jgi:hypothetical protein